MKIFNTKKRRDWASYGIKVEDNSIIMSSYSEIKTNFKSDVFEKLLVIISKNLIGNGIFFVEISGKNLNINKQLCMRGIGTLKNTIPIQTDDDEITVKIYRDKRTTGNILINSLYVYENKKHDLNSDKGIFVDSEVISASDIIDTVIYNEIRTEPESIPEEEHVQQPIISEEKIENELLMTATSQIANYEERLLVESGVIRELSENIEKEENRAITLTEIKTEFALNESIIQNTNETIAPAAEDKIFATGDDKKIRKERRADRRVEHPNPDVVQVTSKIEHLEAVEPAVFVNQNEPTINQKTEKRERLTISIFDLDLVDDENDIMRYSSQISFAKKNNKFFIKNNKDFLLENIKNLNNFKIFKTLDEIISELEKINFDKIVCDKAIEDIDFIDKLNELKSKK